jgi:Protein of unknown function (DUF2867)
MKVHEVTPSVPDTLLAGAKFADAYAVALDGRALDARQAAERMFARHPGWIKALLSLRNMIVAPFGLKTSGEGDRTSKGMIGIFPIMSETPERLVAGFNDSHLDFRVVVDVAQSPGERKVIATTLVKTHNLPGRIYLATILPFHRLVVRDMLRRVVS